jgi:hypothetical protein
LLVSFHQPWAEFLVHRSTELSPLNFADSLVRAELELAGIGLEFNMGYWPDGSLPRDRIEFSRRLDRWSQLDVPIVAFLTVPSGGEPSETSLFPASQPNNPADAFTLETQRARADRLAHLLLAKPYVHGLFWNQLCDADLGGFAHGGLFDDQHCPKPVWDEFSSIRQRYL